MNHVYLQQRQSEQDDSGEIWTSRTSCWTSRTCSGLPAGLLDLSDQSSPEQPRAAVDSGLNAGLEPMGAAHHWEYLRLWNTIINVINLKSCWSLMCCWYSETPLYPDSKLLDD